jgi:hypothetical protein
MHLEAEGDGMSSLLTLSFCLVLFPQLTKKKAYLL